MSTDEDYENDPELMAAVDTLALPVLGKALDGARDEGDPTHARARALAVEICRRAGILHALRAISADGELRPPPPWPQCDIVPVGGGVGFLDVEVRTFSRRVYRVPIRITVLTGKPNRGKLRQDIGAAYERGKWQLRKWIG